MVEILTSSYTGWRGGAVLSACGTYRYHLWRERIGGDSQRRVLFVMLNPSTADSSTDDPTIRKCKGFTERWGYQRFDVVNLFAYRATKPKALEAAWHNGQDIVGPENGIWLRDTVNTANVVVFAWGGSVPKVGHLDRRVFTAVLDMAGPTTNAIGTRPNHAGTPVMCLGYTDGGQPRHPLMLAYTTPLEPFEVKHG